VRAVRSLPKRAETVSQVPLASNPPKDMIVLVEVCELGIRVQMGLHAAPLEYVVLASRGRVPIHQEIREFNWDCEVELAV
jgi:hypothetical protein